MIVMNNSSKIKITLIRRDRVNFRYDGTLYSIQENRWGRTGGVDFRVFDNGKFRYIGGCLDIKFLDINDMFCMKNGENFKGNIVYSHIDSGCIIYYLYSMGFIEANEFVQLAYLRSDLARNRSNQDFLKQEFSKDISSLMEDEERLLEEIKDIENSIKGSRVDKGYDRFIINKYGSWENNINSEVFNLYKNIEKIDKGILDFILKLNSHGCHTVSSCSGHGSNAYVMFATYIDRSKILLEMSKLFGRCNRLYKIEETALCRGTVKVMKMVIETKNFSYFGISDI